MTASKFSLAGIFNKINHLEHVLLLIGFSFVCAFTYSKFAQYQPKALKPAVEIKANSDSSQMLIPYPSDYTRMSVDETSDFEQTTFQTSRSLDEIIDFYTNAMVGKDWEVESEGSYVDSVFIKFKKNDKFLTVNAFDQDNTENTLVVIEITDR